MASSAVLVGQHIVYYNGAMSAGGNVVAFNTETGRAVQVNIDVSSVAEKPVPAARLDYGLCAVDSNKICLFAGQEVGGQERLLNDIWFLELRFLSDGEVHGSWSEVGKESTRAPWPSSRKRHAMTSRGSEVFIAGGYVSEGLGDGIDCWKFDIATSGWQPLFVPKLAARGPPGRQAFYAGVCGENLWCMGGRPTAAAEPAGVSSHCDSVLCFNLVRRDWAEVRCFEEGDRLREAAVWGLCDQQIWALVQSGTRYEAHGADTAAVAASAEREAEQSATVPDKEDEATMRGGRRRKKAAADKDEGATPEDGTAKRRRRTPEDGHVPVKVAVTWAPLRCTAHAALAALPLPRSVSCTPGCGVVAAASHGSGGPEVHVLPSSPLSGAGGLNPFGDADALADFLCKHTSEELRPREDGEDGFGAPIVPPAPHDPELSADEARSDFSLAVTSWPNCGSETGRNTPTELDDVSDGPTSCRGSGSAARARGEDPMDVLQPDGPGAEAPPLATAVPKAEPEELAAAGASAMVPVSVQEDYRKATQFASALAEHIMALQAMQPEFEAVGARIESAMQRFQAHREALQGMQRAIGELQASAGQSRSALGGMRLELLKAEGAVETAAQRVLETEDLALMAPLEEAVETRRQLYEQELATLQEQMRIAREEAGHWGEYAALSAAYATAAGVPEPEVAAIEAEAAAGPSGATPARRSGGEASLAIVAASQSSAEAERLDGEIAALSRKYLAVQDDFRASFAAMFSGLHSRDELARGVALCDRHLEAARGEEAAMRALLQDWARKHLALAARGRREAEKAEADLTNSCAKLEKRSDAMREVEARRDDPALREADWDVHAAAHTLACLRSKIHELEQQRRASPAYRLFRDVQEQIEACQRALEAARARRDELHAPLSKLCDLFPEAKLPLHRFYRSMPSPESAE